MQPNRQEKRREATDAVNKTLGKTIMAYGSLN
jgi:hypothetical protein